MLVNTFVVLPDIFLAYPRNRAYVEGRAKHPPLLEFWLGAVVSLPISLALIVISTGIVPLPIRLPLTEMGWLFLLLGAVGLVGDLFLLWVIMGLRNGKLIEGRVTEADIRPHHSRPNQKMQRIAIEFRDPSGQMQVIVHVRPQRNGLPLPQVRMQAAVLYLNPNIQRVL